MSFIVIAQVDGPQGTSQVETVVLSTPCGPFALTMVLSHLVWLFALPAARSHLLW